MKRGEVWRGRYVSSERIKLLDVSRKRVVYEIIAEAPDGQCLVGLIQKDSPENIRGSFRKESQWYFIPYCGRAKIINRYKDWVICAYRDGDVECFKKEDFKAFKPCK